MKPVLTTALLVALLVAEGLRAESDIDGSVVESYEKTIQSYLQEKSVAEGWEWFAYHSHGFNATPMILIKLLPELDPDIWGPPAEKFSRFGHYVLPGDENRVLPTSLGMSSFSTKENPHPVIVTTETCATCHMGRVRLGDKILPLYGGVNVQFDIRKWRSALEKTVEKYLHSDKDVKAVARQLRDTVRSKPVGFFHTDPQEDVRQRNYFLNGDGAEKMLREFVTWTNGFTKGKKKQRDTAYKKTAHNNPPDIDEGHPGQVDASGDLLSQRLPLEFGMPATASLTDIPSVWLQSEYSVGQWDGSVTNQFIRNLAAQIAVVPGTTVDRRVAFHALQFVENLPAPKFPFLPRGPGPAHDAQIKRGEALFKTNCADCHKPRNDRYYPEVQTDLSRAKVMTRTGGLLLAAIFFEACHARLPDGTSPPSCGNFTKYLRSDMTEDGAAYVAKPLTGLWARAPFFHHGVIPTVRHVIFPGTRPERFVVGSLSYDSENMGYAWDISRIDEYRKLDPYVGIMDTTQDGLSNKGHDQEKLMVDGKVYRLDWTKDEADGEALLEYLKTL